MAVNRRKRAIARGILTGLCCASTLMQGRADEPAASVEGTILSVRGDILVVRPSLRPKMTRVAFGAKTEIVGYERSALSVLRPGMRVGLGGRYSDQEGLHAFFIEASERPIGQLKQRSEGVETDKEHGWATARGSLVSVQPFVFRDDTGKTHTAKLDQLRSVWHEVKGGRNELLIGTRIQATGHAASDGVIQADTIVPDREIAAAGTMFGTITGVKGGIVEVRPKYTTETLRVKFGPGCTLQRQIDLDPDSIKVGSRVTFWGQQHNHTWDSPRSEDLLAFALLVGNGRYPAASGSTGGIFLTGTIASLDPVRLAVAGRKPVQVIVPAQMPIARLEPISRSEIRSGRQAMFVLQRNPDGVFRATGIILDASPFVGYGG